MTIQHSALGAGEIHEPKGITAATAGQVYVADGASSGTWKKRGYAVSAVIADVSTAETVYIPIPYAGNVVRVVGVLSGAISSADALVTVKDNGGNSMGSITVTQSGSAAGDTYTLNPASNQDVTDSDYITIETDGSSSTARVMNFVFYIERDA